MKKLITILAFIPCICFGQWSQVGATINGGSVIEALAMNANGETVVTSAKGSNSSTGKAQIFEWDGTNWAQKGADINGVNSGEQFGESVDISADGNTVLIGAPSLGITSDPGYSAVYEWNGSWVQKGINIIGENTLINGAGGAVSISANGNIIAIGASGNSNSNASFSGHVRVYQWDGTAWIQLGADIDGLNQFDGFGAAVSLNSSGNLVAIGGPSASPGGIAKVYQWNGTNWIQLGATLSGGPNNAFGATVDLDALGTTLSVGADSNDVTFGAGYVEVFSWDGTNWNLKGLRIETDPNGFDFLNQAKLSADGNIVVTGGHGTGSGFVSVFEFDGVDWNIVNNAILPQNGGLRFGQSVDISADGSRIVSRASGEVEVFENLNFPLPIDLIDFHGELIKEQIKLSWVTANESNNYGFDIEKSSNGRDWEVIDFVNGQGNSNEQFNYQSIDEEPYAGINYYRLKQLDYDGQSSFSNIISIDFIKPNSEILVYPNPSNGDINIKIENPNQFKIEAQILDARGRSIWQKKSENGSTFFSESITIETHGIYFMRILIGNEIYFEKLILGTLKK